jgi:hypothetical protein
MLNVSSIKQGPLLCRNADSRILWRRRMSNCEFWISIVTKTVRSAGMIMAASILSCRYDLFSRLRVRDTFGTLRSGFLSADEEILCFIQTQGANKIPALCVVVQLGANDTFTCLYSIYFNTPSPDIKFQKLFLPGLNFCAHKCYMFYRSYTTLFSNVEKLYTWS